MKRAYYSDSIETFLKQTDEQIIGTLALGSEFADPQNQKNAWVTQIHILKGVLRDYKGSVYLEFSIPRMGLRIDAVVIINAVIFVLEFKVGKKVFDEVDLDQVWDYALDLKNFHETSHNILIAPILIPTEAKNLIKLDEIIQNKDKLLVPIKTSSQQLGEVIKNVLKFANDTKININEWENGSYKPTPTIVEAAMALYKGHKVEDISRNDAKAINLGKTSQAVANIIKESREKKNKAICLVTGVPGAGKTLVGLNIATTHINKNNDLYSVFLSGNGPLVSVLREALTRDKYYRERKARKKIKKGEIFSEVKMFIQNVHNFRDECLKDINKPPIEHVALFDEAQRAWNLEQTSNFMQRRKGYAGFNKSEPEFLISCMDRHEDWAVIVCLVGGGQEINTGEAGMSEWMRALNKSFPDWHIHISPKLKDSEYEAEELLLEIKKRKNIFYNEDLHLAVSMRSFRAENLSLLIKQMLDLRAKEAKETYDKLKEKYPIVLTRDLNKAKKWLRFQARGSERYGIVVSSQAERLKPYAIDVKSPMDPIHWFLDGKEDVRSSYYLEDVATEFHVQGLELDWACVTWDADFRYTDNGWQHWSFCGDRWNNIRKDARKKYLKNAYRVLLTRARQGMVIVVPEGDSRDLTRKADYYNSTYDYLKEIGLNLL
jgi:hypothetical protein